MEMGFGPARIEAALCNAGDSLEDCVQWLENNQAKFEAQANATRSIEGATEEGNTGKTVDLAIEEEQPKRERTEEEKAAHLEELKARAEIRKAERTKQEAEEKKRNALLRRKNAAEEIRLREELRQKEALREAAKRKREAREDMLAKRSIKELIEQDKRARAERSGAKSAIGGESSSTLAASTSSKSTNSTPRPRANPSESKLRLRVQSTNAQLLEIFPVDATLSEVADRVASQVGVPADTLFFLTTFPTKRYALVDFHHTLKEVGLVNANVTVGW